MALCEIKLPIRRLSVPVFVLAPRDFTLNLKYSGRILTQTNLIERIQTQLISIVDVRP